MRVGKNFFIFVKSLFTAFAADLFSCTGKLTEPVFICLLISAACHVVAYKVRSGFCQKE